MEFDEDAVKALLSSELTLVSYNLGLAKKRPDKMLVFFDARNPSGGQHLVATTIGKEHFRVGQGYAISEVWGKALSSNFVVQHPFW